MNLFKSGECDHQKQSSYSLDFIISPRQQSFTNFPILERKDESARIQISNI